MDPKRGGGLSMAGIIRDPSSMRLDPPKGACDLAFADEARLGLAAFDVGETYMHQRKMR